MYLQSCHDLKNDRGCCVRGYVHACSGDISNLCAIYLGLYCQCDTAVLSYVGVLQFVSAWHPAADIRYHSCSHSEKKSPMVPTQPIIWLYGLLIGNQTPAEQKLDKTMTYYFNAIEIVIKVIVYPVILKRTVLL